MIFLLGHNLGRWGMMDGDQAMMNNGGMVSIDGV